MIKSIDTVESSDMCDEKRHNQKYKLVFMVILASMAFVAMLQPALATTVEFDGGLAIEASLSNGSVGESGSIDSDFSSVLLSLTTDPTADGQLVLSMPRHLIDAKTPVGEDGDFIVFIDGEQAADFTESHTSDTARELTIPVQAGATEVEIVGTQVIPEFPVAVLGGMAAVVGIVAVLGRVRLLN